MSATASLDPRELSVEPGATVSAVLRVRNTGPVLDQFSVQVVGPSANWAHIEPPSIPLFPGAEGTVTLIASPPRSPSVPAGACPFGLKVKGAEDPEGSVLAEGVINIAPFFDITAELVPRASRGRRTGVHELAVDNRSNVAFNADFGGFDPDSLLGFAFSPPIASIAPGNAAFTKVRVKARRTFWRGGPFTRPFEIQVRNDQIPAEFAEPTGLGRAGGDEPTGPTPIIAPSSVTLPGSVPTATATAVPAAAASASLPPATPSAAVAPTLSLDGSMVQEAMLPGWLPELIAAIVALTLVMTLLWFTLFKPQIKSAAKDQVNHQLAASGIVATSGSSAGKPLSGNSSSVTTPATGAGGGTKATGPSTGNYSGVAVDGRLNVVGNKSQGFIVPAGKVLSLTDVDFQNPAGDTGTVILARNNAVLFQLSMANFRDLDYHWISLIVFAGGEQLQLIATGCSSACTPGLYYAGYLSTSG